MNLNNLKNLVNNKIKEKEKELAKIEVEKEKIQNIFDKIFYQKQKIPNFLIFYTLLQTNLKTILNDINSSNLTKNINLLKDFNDKIDERFKIYAVQKENNIEINKEYENEVLLNKIIEKDFNDFLRNFTANEGINYEA